MSKDRGPQQGPLGEPGASLLDAESRGGPTAIKGFDFQRRYALILLLESLPDPDWSAVLVEGAEDVEVRFDRQGRVERRAIQLKNYRVTAAKAREIVGHLQKLGEDSPGTWVAFVIACAELDDILKTIHDGLERYRPSGSFYSADDAILVNTRADLERQIRTAKLPVDFVLERVVFEPGLKWYKDEDLVRARALDLLHKAYPGIGRAAAEDIYLRLKDLVAESTVRPIERRQVEGIINAVRAQITAPADYYPIKLRAPLREVFDPLLEDRIRVFGGREGALARIASFVQEPKGGYLVVTAPPGFGKTALMAKLVSAAPEAYAYHFFTRLYGEDSLSEPFFVKNVAQQMAEWHGHQGELPDGLPELRALYQQFIREPLDKTQVLVIDGLDEVARWDLAPYLSGHLPERLHLILTVRDVGQDWRGQYRLPPDQVTHLPLGGLDEDDIADVLRAAGGAAPALAEDRALLGEIHRVAAYQADQTLGADPLYVRLLAEDAAAGRLSAGEIEKRPQGLDDYLKVWWEQVRAMAGDEPARDLFGTLTVALGPMLRADLEAINPSLVDDWTADRFDEVLGQVRRFVTGDDRHGYAMAHPRLQEYMRAHIKTGAYRDRLLAHCARWQEHRSRYALSHYATHLADAGRNDDLYKLIGKPWMEAKLALFQSHHRFKEDVTLAVDAAAAETPVRWDQLVRGSLISASVSSMATNVPPEVLGVLAQAGDPDRLAQARGYAALITDRESQTEAYRLIGEALASQGRTDEAKEVLRQARAAAEAIGGVESRASALNGVAQALAQAGDRGAATQAARQALAPLEAFRDEESYAQALSGYVQVLAQVGDQEGLRRALAAAEEIGAEQYKSRALGRVAQALAQVGDREGLQQALAAAEALRDEEHGARALGWLAHTLADVGDKETALRAARQSLAAANKIGQEEARARALGRVTQPLARLGDEEGLRLVLDAAEQLGDRWCRTRVLGWVAGALAEAGDKELAFPAARQALAAAKAIRAKKDRAKALQWVARLLAQVGDKESLEQALAAAEATGDDADHAEALRVVAQALVQAGDEAAAIQAARQALSTAQAIGDQDAKADLLGEVAQTLAQVGDVDGLRQALAAAEEIEGNLSMAWTLSEVAHTLAQVGDRAGLGQVLLIAEAIGDRADKVEALSGVAQALARVGDKEAAAQAARQAVATAEAFRDEPYKAEAFGGVAQALAQAGEREAAAQAARRALVAAEAIGDNENRAEALSGLAQALAQAGEDEAALRAAQQALVAAEAIEGGLFGALQLSKAALALAQAGDKAAATRAARQALAVEKDDEMGLELDWVARALAQVGDVDGLGQALTIVEAIGDEQWKPAALSGVARALAQVGDAQGLGQAVQLAEAILDMRFKAQSLSGVALALAQAGDREAAAQSARQALAAAEGITDEENKTQALTEVAQALAQAGDKAAAVQAAQQALVAADAIVDEESKAWALNGVAQALFQAGDGGAAIQAARRVLEVVEEGIAQEMMRRTEIEDEGDKAEILGEALETLVQAGDKEGLQQALAVAEAIEGTADKADALAEVARALAQVGDMAAAIEVARRALATAEALGDKQYKAGALTRVAMALAYIAQPDQALRAFVEAFKSGGSAGRESVFAVLEQAAATLAGIDGGQTLRRVNEELMAVEAWWGG